MSSDRYISTASFSIGTADSLSKDVKASPILGHPRAHPSPSFYRTGAQPIHPVLQRRNTPIRLPRRMTQPVPSNLNFYASEPDFEESDENLTCDRTGRLPIPPPRGPKNRSPVVRNVSQNGLRSPKLSPKVSRACPMNGSPGTRYENSFDLDSWENAGLRAKLPLPKTDGPKKSLVNRPVGQNGIFGAPRRSKFYIEIPLKSSPPGTPPVQTKVTAVDGDSRLSGARIRKLPLVTQSGAINYRQDVAVSPPSFDAIVDEIFKTIGSNELDYNGRRHQASGCGAGNGEVFLRNNRIGGVHVLTCDNNRGIVRQDDNGPKNGEVKHDSVEWYPAVRRRLREPSPPGEGPKRAEPFVSRRTIQCQPLLDAPRLFHVDGPSAAVLHRSKSDATRDRFVFKRRLSALLLPTVATVSSDLCNMPGQSPSRNPHFPVRGEWMQETTEVHYSQDENAAAPSDKNVMQRMRRSLGNLRSGVMARLQQKNSGNFTGAGGSRKGSYECDITEEAQPSNQCVFYDMGREEGLLKPINPTPNLPKTRRKPTSADSGIMDQDGDDTSTSSRRHIRRAPSSDYSSSNSPMRRSRSQPPKRMVSFVNDTVTTAAEEKSSDLDRSISARSSRTSDVSDTSISSPAEVASPMYIESLWSQVKYEVDCQQNILESSPEGMRANVVKEIVQNERNFVNNLKDVIEGYLYKCRQRSDMFSKGRIECIFGNLEQLYEFQCDFLADLEASVIGNNVHRSEIGHCFLLHQRGFSDLYSDYCNRHSQSAGELQQLKQIKQYAHFFEACRMLQEMVEISLDGFLLQPVQKICKYPLQLMELLKYTPDDHPDCQSVKLALKAMKNVTGMINERKRRLECLEKIALWQETIDNWQEDDLVELSSQLIHYGDLSKLSSKNSWTHEYTFFLFDHQLIYCRRDILKRTVYSYKGRFDLKQVEIVDLDQNEAGIKHGWVMVCPDRELSTILLAKSLEEKNRWMEAFRDERRRVKMDITNGFFIAPKDRLAAIQSAKMLTAGKEKRSRTKDALKDLTDHTRLDQSMRSRSISMTLPLRIRGGQAGSRKNPFANGLPLFTSPKRV